MFSGNFFLNFDITLIALYLFWAFFLGLVIYLNRESKREGYPLVSDVTGRAVDEGWTGMPSPKTFILPHGGGTVMAPRPETAEVLPIHPTKGGGDPIEPMGDPMQLGLGPAAYAQRADHPHLCYDDHQPSIVPLRAAPDFYLAEEDPDPRGMVVLDADGEMAGTVVDVWVDRAEYLARFLEVQTPMGRRVLAPAPLVRVDETAGEVKVNTLLARHFEAAPVTESPEQITLREEDQIQAYFASGQLYAKPERSEPCL
jgi:photosynthetic reaction center H subunit